MSDIKGLRELSDDPFGKLLTLMSKKFSAFLAKDQAAQVENPEDIYSDGQDVDSAIKYHNFAMSKQFDLTTNYYSPSEPDGDNKCRLWLRGDNLGNTINDISGSDRSGNLFGDPALVSGEPFDYGIYDSTNSVKSVAIRLNRPTSDLENREYITVAANARHRAMESLTTGISFFLRFRVFDLANQASWSRTLLQKRDDETALPNNGLRVLVGSDGRIIVRIRRTDGTQYNKQTAAGTIAINTVYEMWITYTVSGNVVHIYLNNTDMTLTDPGASSSWDHASDADDTDWYIFKHAGVNSQDGYVYGDFYDFEVLREKVVSATEVGRHFTNKWTIADIPFGQVLISDYWSTYQNPPIGDFEPDSFEGDSFELVS